MAITAEQAAQLASTYQAGDTSGLQGLVNQMGVTQADVAQYFPGFDVGSLQGVTLAPSDAQKAAQAQATQGSYSDLKPGNIDIGMMPSTYGTAGKLGAEDIKNYVAANIGDPGAIARAMQQTGVTQQNLADIYKGTAYTPASIAQYLSSPAAKLYGTSYEGGKQPLTAKESFDYIMANLADPTRVSQAATSRGYTAQDLLDIANIYAPERKLTKSGIEEYLAAGKAGFGKSFEDLVGSVFGTGDELTNLKTSLYDSIVDYIEGLPNVSNEKKQQLIAAQTPESVFSKIINPKDYESKSLEDILTALQSTSVNKQQEANRVAGIAQNLYGITDTQATTLANDLIKGTKTDPLATDIYNKLLKGGLTEDLQTQILQDAAVRAPGSKYFQDNPEALLIYKPLEEKDVSTGGYGYLNKAPILNANWAIENMGERNQIIPHLGSEPNKFGWITNSKYAETLMRGPAIYGVEFNNRNDIEKAIDFERRIKDGTIVNDPEGGYYDTVKNIGVEAPKSDNERKGYNPYSSDTLATLQDAAQKAGLDPANYRSAGDLYDALEDKTKDIYQVSGRAINYDPEIAKSLGVTQTTSGRGGVNHVSALYKKVGDKLIPLTAKAFEFHDPNTSRGFFGDLARDVASIPFAPEIISAATGGNPAVYAALKGAQTLALGGDAEAALKSAGLAYLTSNYIPKTVTPNVQMYLAQNPLISSLAQSSPELANFIVNAGTKAVVSSGLAAITGQDPEKAMLSALVSSGLGTLTKEGVKIAGIPQEYQSIVSNILSSVILNQDPTKSLTGAATNLLKNELKDFGREMIKSDQDKDRSKEIRT